MNKLTKNFTLALPFAGALLLSGCGTQDYTPTSDLPTIIVADAITTHHLNLYVAYELGLFESHGVNVVLNTLDTNAAARDLVAAGQADVFFSCPTIAIAAIANGAPMRTIAQVKDPCTSVLYMAAGHGVTSFEDLAGLAIAGIGPACEAVLSLVLAARAEAGVEIDLQVMGGGPSIAALEAGQVAGALLEEPHASIAELAGFERVFEHLSAGVTCRTINASNSIITAQPEALIAFMAAIDEANEIIMSNPVADNIVEIAVLHTGAPEDAIRHGNHRLIFNSRLESDGLFYLADALLQMEGNLIPENPFYDMFAEPFRGITWS